MTATDKQLSFIGRLLSEKQLTPATAKYVDAGALLALTTRDASTLINELLALPRKANNNNNAVAAPAVEGMHRLDGVIYKVQKAVHGSGNLYAKRLSVKVTCPGHLDFSDPSAFDAPWTFCPDAAECPNKQVDASFEYAPGAVKKLNESTRMTLAEAKEWGALYGVCASCSKTLTREDSIERGYGKVCAKKFA